MNMKRLLTLSTLVVLILTLSMVLIAKAETTLPATVNSEIGEDFRLSSMGPDTNPDYDALDPAVAYNSTDDQYLVVWSGSDDIVGEYEIWGQLVNAVTGAQIGADFQISFMGPADDPDYDASEPDVAYNSQNQEYLVVWAADHYADGDTEIWGRRVATDGTTLSAMVRVSVMGSGIDVNYDARSPSIAYNSQDNEYLVVWDGDDDDASLANDEFEIWGRLLESDADWIGDDFRISSMGSDGDANYDAFDPDVAYNSTRNEYMVVWEGDDQAYDRADDEFEIFGRRFSADGIGLGFNGFRISTMGPNNDPDLDAGDPAITYNDANDEFLVVWEGEDAYAELYDIFGQRLAYNGVQVGEDDFYLSDSGNGPNSGYDALNPAVDYDRANKQYMVVWQDDELGADEFEIWGQRVDAVSGDQIKIDTRLSDMGTDGDSAFIAQNPAIAYSGVSNNQYLIVWSGDDSTDGEFEIWSQRFAGETEIFIPLVVK